MSESTTHKLNPSPTELKQAWIITLTSGLFFFYEFIQLTMFNTLTPHLMRDFGISAGETGLISSYYFLAEITLLFIAGIVIDRVSTRKLILFFMSLCVSSTILFAMSTSIAVATFCRFLEGLGAAFCFMCSLKLAADWLPPQKVALASGLLVTMAMMGGVVSQTPLEMLIEYLGSWRQAMYVNACMGTIFIVLIATVVKDKNEFTRPEKIDFKYERSLIVMALRNPLNWLAGLYTCLINIPIFIFGALFGILFLTQIHHLSTPEAATVSSMVFWGTVFGSPFYGWLSDLIGLRRMPMIFGALLSIANIIAIIFWPDPSYMTLITLFFSLGFVTSCQIITYPLVTESNPHKITGTSLGIASTLIMSGGAIFQPLFGMLLEKHWDGKAVDGVSIYSASDYHLALMIFPIIFIISVMASLLIKETYCQHCEHDT